MRRAAEVLSFLGLAVGLHLAPFLTLREAGSDAAGQGGDAAFSVAAANASMARMVESWQDTPQTAPIPPAQPTPMASPAPAMGLRLDRAAEADIRLPAMDQPTAWAEAPPATPPTLATPTLATAQQAAPQPIARPKLRPADLKPARAASVPSASRAEQRAAGAGATAEAGTASATASTAATGGKQAQLKAIWGQEIGRRIQRANRLNRAHNSAVRAQLQVVVNRNGTVASVRLVQSSGDVRLDRSALDSVRRAGRFPAAPRQLDGQSFAFRWWLS